MLPGFPVTLAPLFEEGNQRLRVALAHADLTFGRARDQRMLDRVIQVATADSKPAAVRQTESVDAQSLVEEQVRLDLLERELKHKDAVLAEVRKIENAMQDDEAWEILYEFRLAG